LKVFYVTPSSGSWSQRFRKVTSYGLENAFAALPPDGVVTADGWLRVVLFARIAADFESTPVEGCDGARTPYIEAAQGVPHVIREPPSRGLLTSVSEDVESLLVLLNAGVGDGTVSASAAKAADEALRSPRCSILYDALKLTATGKEYYTYLQDLLQRSCEDDLADSRLALAYEPYHDQAMIKMGV
jgi:hypothetical protein